MTRCVWGSFTDNQCRKRATGLYMDRPSQPVCKAHMASARLCKAYGITEADHKADGGTTWPPRNIKEVRKIQPLRPAFRGPEAIGKQDEAGAAK